MCARLLFRRSSPLCFPFLYGSFDWWVRAWRGDRRRREDSPCRTLRIQIIRRLPSGREGDQRQLNRIPTSDDSSRNDGRRQDYFASCAESNRRGANGSATRYEERRRLRRRSPMAASRYRSDLFRNFQGRLRNFFHEASGRQGRRSRRYRASYGNQVAFRQSGRPSMDGSASGSKKDALGRINRMTSGRNGPTFSMF